METVTLSINQKTFTIPCGSTVASAVLAGGARFFRYSVSGERRAALCGMGVCFECRLRINGVEHQRSCQILVENGMEIETDEQD